MMPESGNISRRRFLNQGAATTSAVMLAPSVLRAVAGGDDIRCGMIGTGGRGLGVLGSIHRSPGVRVTALCDIHAGRLNQAAGMVAEDRPRLFSDYRRLIDFKELDAIFVETPCYLHAEMVLPVLASGRHCYAEKPMALTVRDCDVMLEAAKRAKGIYQIGTQLRYASPWQPGIELIQSGKLGKPIFVRGQRHGVGDYPSIRRWFFFRKFSGDTMVEQAVHEFDLFNWALGGVPLRASAFGALGLHDAPEGRDTIDHYTLSMDYGEKGQVSYSHGWISAPKMPHEGWEQLIYCEKGAIHLETGKVYPREGEAYDVSDKREGDWNDLAVNDFFRCIREKDQPLANAESGRNATLVSLLARKAIDEGRVVTWKELLSEGA